MISSIIVKTSFNAEHRWVNAPNEVSFLRTYHPHTFFVEVEISVDGMNRELEFFMVKREIDKIISKKIPKRFEASCEIIANIIITGLKRIYGNDRTYVVTVSEDNVNAGRLRYGTD